MGCPRNTARVFLSVAVTLRAARYNTQKFYTVLALRFLRTVLSTATLSVGNRNTVS